MRLRIARKIDARLKRQAYTRRRWWQKYTTEQLRCASKRLSRSWIRMCPVEIEETTGRVYRSLTPDFFASNRLESFAIRRPRILRDCRAPKLSYPSRPR